MIGEDIFNLYALVLKPFSVRDSVDLPTEAYLQSRGGFMEGQHCVLLNLAFLCVYVHSLVPYVYNMPQPVLKDLMRFECGSSRPHQTCVLRHGGIHAWVFV